MKLTGKAARQLKEWYKNVYAPNHYPWTFRLFAWLAFKMDTPSEQWGVYQDFADSVGVYISDWGFVDDVIGMKAGYDGSVKYGEDLHFLCEEKFFETRQEARDAALEKFNEILNNT